MANRAKLYSNRERPESTVTLFGPISQSPSWTVRTMYQLNDGSRRSLHIAFCGTWIQTWSTSGGARDSPNKSVQAAAAAASLAEDHRKLNRTSRLPNAIKRNEKYIAVSFVMKRNSLRLSSSYSFASSSISRMLSSSRANFRLRRSDFSPVAFNAWPSFWAFFCILSI